MCAYRKIKVLTLSILLGILIVACGKKDDLFLPEENTQVNTTQQQPSQQSKEEKKKKPVTDN